jgi:mRNA interferase RelE/StbE
MLSTNPRPPAAIALSGGSGELRIRIGDYRVVYAVDDAQINVLVLRVRHRKEAYR